jgi:hypothetical protein
MKLKEFNSENCISSTSRVSAPTIMLDTKTGGFRLNKAAVNHLALKAGAQVKFHQDEDNPDEWYVEVVKEKGFVLRAGTGANKECLTFNNAKLAREICDSVAYTGRSGRVLIAGQPTPVEKRKLFGLLTSGLKN